MIPLWNAEGPDEDSQQHRKKFLGLFILANKVNIFC